MLIGQNFDKIEWRVFDIIIQEPNVFITDTVMAIISLYLGFLLHSKKDSNAFTKWWYAFFVLFGISSFFGGLGHAWFFYFGAKGKMINWVTGFIAIYFIERAMISAVDNLKKRKLYERWVLGKLIFIFAVFSWVIATQPIDSKPELGFLPLAIHTIIGVFSTAGILAYSLSKVKNEAYKYFYYGVGIILPSAFFFLLKINPVNWFDKNDVSHAFMTVGIIFFYLGVQKVNAVKAI
ncbi:MAG: hypothetical protein EBQ94_10900 [Flavobacteriales bacterium]|nr:hypothetical protein [Crocinitomicaceae bacterium]NBX80864.1 hypothetical protein [Flavobacteriales bacterium]NCA19900.1 hypothetical protein [Crocinitomicaceae bacterium]